MIYKRENINDDVIMSVAQKMCTAAITAPKGHGIDNINVLILDGDDKKKLSDAMREIASETGEEFYTRDAKNVEACPCIVLIGINAAPIGLKNCGLCGFENCAATVKAGATCAFNTVDLGIAIGSAVSIAADNRIDNRVLFSAGKAALRINAFPEKVRVCFGIPLSVSGKSLFFDRPAIAK